MKTATLILTFLIGATLGICFGSSTNHKNICTNNNTRDYVYEAYCDSIWNTDKDYYLDVLAETEEYQLYIESHGSWWANNN